ncbi:HAMP domain-containing histidine kinase [Pseudoalteromonas sp. MMG013]|uniref:HAMP domain-containing histidine kinase n=1 Tax=Pseudoalteromonas sp. MMG013 TaxID=2822687 RepID=UPI001B35D52B|nr:HAMP domain-containing histidine kinase [Pseudoalteromonas sp. MMG013]MBQ4860412.1 HAMP domain-containing histidine kinase [Pseudoalteromonas sp. MMG013]
MMSNNQSLVNYLIARFGLCALIVMFLWGCMAKVSYDFALDETAAHYLFYDAEQAVIQNQVLPYTDDFKLITSDEQDLPAWALSLWKAKLLPINDIYFSNHQEDAVYILPYLHDANTPTIFVMHYFDEDESAPILPFLMLLMGALTTIFLYVIGKAAYRIKQQTRLLEQLITPEHKALEFKFIELQNIADALLISRQAERYAQQKDRLLSAYLSHEVRTPLTQIRHSLARLQQLDDLPFESLSIIEQLECAQANLTETSTAILALWHLNPHEIKPINLSATINTVAALYTTHGLIHNLITTEETFINAHQPLVSLLLTQVYRNALQHGNGEVTTTLSHTRMVFSNPCIASKMDTKGSGLGLLLLKQICQKLNWHHEIAHEPPLFSLEVIFSKSI